MRDPLSNQERVVKGKTETRDEPGVWEGTGGVEDATGQWFSTCGL